VEFLVILLFYENKIPTVNMKVKVSSNFSQKNSKENEIFKLHEEWKIEHFQVQEQASRNGGAVYTPSPQEA
jgi:hypothetical protein